MYYFVSLCFAGFALLVSSVVYLGFQFFVFGLFPVIWLLGVACGLGILCGVDVVSDFGFLDLGFDCGVLDWGIIGMGLIDLLLFVVLGFG